MKIYFVNIIEKRKECKNNIKLIIIKEKNDINMIEIQNIINLHQWD